MKPTVATTRKAHINGEACCKCGSRTNTLFCFRENGLSMWLCRYKCDPAAKILQSPPLPRMRNTIDKPSPQFTDADRTVCMARAQRAETACTALLQIIEDASPEDKLAQLDVLIAAAQMRKLTIPRQRHGYDSSLETGVDGH